VCNDIAVASDGTVYATESFNNRIHRLKPGATALDMWITDPKLAAVDGVALLADGAVYVNTFFSGEIFRIPVNADGSAGALVKIETSMPLTRPDGLRTVGPQTLIQAEGGGRLAELTIKGDRAEMRVLREGLPSCLLSAPGPWPYLMALDERSAAGERSVSAGFGLRNLTKT
jgi:sugar lactone lactonase YvrE